MTHNNRIQDDDLRLLTAISDKFKQAITAGETTSIETVLDEAPVRLRDHLLSKVLSIQLHHDQR